MFLCEFARVFSCAGAWEFTFDVMNWQCKSRKNSLPWHCHFYMWETLESYISQSRFPSCEIIIHSCAEYFFAALIFVRIIFLYVEKDLFSFFHFVEPKILLIFHNILSLFSYSQKLWQRQARKCSRREIESLRQQPRKVRHRARALFKYFKKSFYLVQ